MSDLVQAVMTAMMDNAHPGNEDAEPGNWCDEHSVDGETEHFAKIAVVAVLRTLIEQVTLRDADGKAYAREQLRPGDLTRLANEIEAA